MSDRWRCFIGIPLGGVLRAELSRAQAELEAAAPGVRWIDPGAWHVTLAFLGDVEVRRIDALVARFRSLVGGEPPTLAPTDLVPWPAADDARMIWCRFAADPALLALHDRVAGGLPVTDRRRWRPHATLARAPGGRAVAMPAWPADVAPHVAEQVDVVTLYRSHLDPAGSRYEQLASVSLGGASA